MTGWRPDGLHPCSGGYRLGADPRPPRLVLLPGIGGDARVFLRQVPLASRRPVAALDLPPGRSIPELADAVAVLLPPQPVVIFGASLGGLVGWSLSVRFPGRVAGLVTLGTLPHPDAAPRRIGPAGALLGRLPAPVFSALYRRRIRTRMTEEGIPEPLRARLLAGLPDRDTLSARLGAVAAWRPEGPPSVPALWLRGQVDHEIAWDSATLRRHLPGVGVEVVPGGHRAHITHPRPLHAVLDHFLASLRR